MGIRLYLSKRPVLSINNKQWIGRECGTRFKFRAYGAYHPEDWFGIGKKYGAKEIPKSIGFGTGADIPRKVEKPVQTFSTNTEMPPLPPLPSV